MLVYSMTLKAKTKAGELTIENNKIYGIKIHNYDGPPNDNNIYKNDLINNLFGNAYDEGNNNIWDDGALGNYWSDYNGTDNDDNGIGDTPYNITGNGNQDRFPLIHPYGSVTNLDTGEVLIHGEKSKIKSTKDSTACGIALVPEDRRNQGLILDFSIKDNLLLPILRRLVNFFLINDRKGKTIVQNYMTGFNIKAANMEQTVTFLSGGNQQKVVMSKWLCSNADILIFDEPTRGIDVGSKVEIYQLMNQLTATGVAIIMISSELPEILGMSDRILVMHKGRITGEFPIEEANQEKLLQCALGE